MAAAAPGGDGSLPPLGGGTKTVPPWEGPNGRRPNQPVESGGGPLQPPNGGGGGIGPPFMEREGCLNDQWEEELLHLVVMEMVMGMVMRMEGAVDCLPQGKMEKEVAMMMGDNGDDGGRDDSPLPLDQGQPQHH